MTETKTDNKNLRLQNKKNKNWAILAIIAAFVIIIWAVTMIKIGNMS